MFRAIVKNNKDPLYLGRVQVHIPALFGGSDIDINSLPWASYCSPFPGGMGFGSYVIPPIGSYVWVTREVGTDDGYIYFGGVYSIDNISGIYGKDGVDVSRVTGAGYDIPVDELGSMRDILYKSLKGSEISVDDREGKEEVAIRDYAGLQVRLKSRTADRGRNPKEIVEQYVEVSGDGFKFILGGDRVIGVEVGDKSYDIDMDVGAEIAKKQGRFTLYEGVLTESGWEAGEQELEVVGITDSSLIIIDSLDGSKDSYGKFMIRGISQGEDYVRFSCEGEPNVDIGVRVVFGEVDYDNK